MPYKPKRPCSYPGCPKLTDGRYCEEHQKIVTAHYNKHERDPASKKRYGRAWKRIRDRYIAAHPLCEECRKAGKVTPAEEVHHIKPLSRGGTHAEGIELWGLNVRTDAEAKKNFAQQTGQ